MKLITKTPELIIFSSDMNISLANAIRRSVGKVPILAINETDIYKNDSALYDEIISHRLGLIPLKNQKLKKDQTIEFKITVKGKAGGSEVLANEMGSEIVYPETPIVLLEEGQELKLVARADVKTGKDHARYSPGIIYYHQLSEINLSSEGLKQIELAELYPTVFEESSGKLVVKNAWASDFDVGDFKEYPGVEIVFGKDLVFSIESWGQIEALDIFTESCKALKNDLLKVSKVIK